MALPDTLLDAAAALRSGRVTSAALVDHALEEVGRHNAATHAFIQLDADHIRKDAQTADDELGMGIDRGPLHGLPISLKDLIDLAGQPTTAASRVFADRVAAQDAVVTARLKAAGALLFGKTNLHEFALGTTSEDSAYGPVLHPRDHSRSAGGSSGGSAVAVATGMGLASLGTDTGGSIRIPAAACGIVGLKPSVEDVPATGVVPLSVTLDHVGPLTRTVRDAALLWAILADAPITEITEPSPNQLRLLQLDGYFSGPLDDDVRKAFADAVTRLTQAGTSIAAAEFSDAAAITETYVNIVLPEGASFHAPWLDPRAELYSPAVRDRLRAGRDIKATAYIEARRRRRLMQQIVDGLLQGADALILPTLPIVAPVSGHTDVIVDGVTMPVRTAMLKHTQLFNITGHPAISLPLPTAGLPVGLQLVGQRGGTPRLLAVAAAVESVLCR